MIDKQSYKEADEDETSKIKYKRHWQQHGTKQNKNINSRIIQYLKTRTNTILSYPKRWADTTSHAQFVVFFFGILNPVIFSCRHITIDENRISFFKILVLIIFFLSSSFYNNLKMFFRFYNVTHLHVNVCMYLTYSKLTIYSVLTVSIKGKFPFL